MDVFQFYVFNVRPNYKHIPYGIPHIQQWNTPYPATEYPISLTSLEYPISEWNNPFARVEYPISRTSIPPPPAPPPQNHTPTLPKSHSDFTKITLQLYQNHTPTLPKSHSDFTKITLRLYQNHTPTLPQSQSDFTKIKPWLCLKPPIPSYNYICKIQWKQQPNTYLSPSFSML